MHIYCVRLSRDRICGVEQQFSLNLTTQIMQHNAGSRAAASSPRRSGKVASSKCRCGKWTFGLACASSSESMCTITSSTWWLLQHCAARCFGDVMSFGYADFGVNDDVRIHQRVVRHLARAQFMQPDHARYRLQRVADGAHFLFVQAGIDQFSSASRANWMPIYAIITPTTAAATRSRKV